MDIKNVKIEFGTDQERRQALVDCTDIMWETILMATQNKGLIETFLLAKELHNRILGQMVK